MASQLFLRKGTALLQPTAAPVRAFQILLNSRRLRANRPVDDPRNVAPNAEKVRGLRCVSHWAAADCGGTGVQDGDGGNGHGRY